MFDARLSGVEVEYSTKGFWRGWIGRVEMAMGCCRFALVSFVLLNGMEALECLVELSVGEDDPSEYESVLRLAKDSLTKAMGHPELRFTDPVELLSFCAVFAALRYYRIKNDIRAEKVTFKRMVEKFPGEVGEYRKVAAFYNNVYLPTLRTEKKANHVRKQLHQNEAHKATFDFLTNRKNSVLRLHTIDAGARRRSRR